MNIRDALSKFNMEVEVYNTDLWCIRDKADKSIVGTLFYSGSCVYSEFVSDISVSQPFAEIIDEIIEHLDKFNEEVH